MLKSLALLCAALACAPAAGQLTSCDRCDPLAACQVVLPNVLVVCGDCPAGYSGSGVTGCVDVDECAFTGLRFPCAANAVCTNTPGSFRCVCEPGFTGADASVLCSSTDACARSPCGLNTDCTGGASGAYTCACKCGFGPANSRDCVDIAECAGANECAAERPCLELAGGYACDDCPAALSLVNAGPAGCKLVDACSPNPCFSFRTCETSALGFVCSACPPGSELNATHCADPCIACGGGRTCSVAGQVATCGPCPPGTQGDRCEFVACSGLLQCPPHRNCVNTDGGIACGPCATGYAGDPCVWVGLCGTQPCGDHAVCVHEEGSARVCTCDLGYAPGGNGTCTLVDGCLVANGGCGAAPANVCSAGGSGVSCACGGPFYAGAPPNCANVNACADANGGCHAQRECVPSATVSGERTCGACAEFWEPAGETGCVSTQACPSPNEDYCLPEGTVSPCALCATCHQAAGEAPVCTCPGSFRGDPYVECVDFDECNDPSDNVCDDGSAGPETCINTEGSYSCSGCGAGFELTVEVSSGDRTCTLVSACDEAACAGACLPGLLAKVYGNKDLGGDFAVSAMLPNVNFNAGSQLLTIIGRDFAGAASEQTFLENFSIRWTGSLKPPVAGLYTFYAGSDDGSRLSIGGTLIIDSWVNRPYKVTNSTPLTLQADVAYDLVFEFYEAYGAARATLEWSSDSGVARAIVPQDVLRMGDRAQCP